MKAKRTVLVVGMGALLLPLGIWVSDQLLMSPPAQTRPSERTKPGTDTTSPVEPAFSTSEADSVVTPQQRQMDEVNARPSSLGALPGQVEQILAASERYDLSNGDPRPLVDLGLELRSFLINRPDAAPLVIAEALRAESAGTQFVLMDALAGWSFSDVSELRTEATAAVLDIYLRTPSALVRSNALTRLGNTGDADAALTAVEDYLSRGDLIELGVEPALRACRKLLGMEASRLELAKRLPAGQVVRLEDSRASVERIVRLVMTFQWLSGRERAECESLLGLCASGGG